LDAFRLEELMNPDDTIGPFQQDEEHAAKDSRFPAPLAKLVPEDEGPNSVDSGVGKMRCWSFSLVSYEELCIEPNGWPWRVPLRSTADDEVIEYGDYKRVGLGFVPRERKYRDGDAVVEEADVKHLEGVISFPGQTFAPPDGAENIDWCFDEAAARLLPLKGDLPVTPSAFQYPEIADAFVKADGIASRLEILVRAARSGTRRSSKLRI
jgi:hypothetical protein